MEQHTKTSAAALCEHGDFLAFSHFGSKFVWIKPKYTQTHTHG